VFHSLTKFFASPLTLTILLASTVSLTGCDEELLAQLRKQNQLLKSEEFSESLNNSESSLAEELARQLQLQGEELSVADIEQYLNSIENENALSSQLTNSPSESSSSGSGLSRNSSNVNALTQAKVGLDSASLHLINAVEIPYCAQLKVTTPRGLSCMHCLHPKARANAKILQVLMLKSCLQNISTSYLVDGTFSFDYTQLLSDITTLSTGGRKLFVHFYLTNGPAQRRFQTTPLRTLGTKISPILFRQQVLNDFQVQSDYQYLVRRLVPVMRYAASMGSLVTLTPALEDNLSDEAFNKLGDLTVEAIPFDIPFAIGRNPCPGCYSGNGREVPNGYFREVHTVSPFLSVENGIVSNDGTDYAFPSERRSEHQTTLEELATLRDASARKNNIFILWSGKRQGLTDYQAGSILPDPNGRNYQIPSIAERVAIVDFLKGN